jgi:periplasmic divalent cation tolerance protein
MLECSEDDIVSVTTTAPGMEAAAGLGRRIVQERLAACVQLDEIAASIYEWEGRLCKEAEVRLTIKTTGGCLQALQALLAEHHPYELPQFLVVRCGASDAYSSWVRAAVSS